jgi:Mrp family chromosome partitioning ATPase
MKSVGIASVKGGVGKSVIALNIAKKLSEHTRVGFVDADVDNPNFAQFTNLNANIDIENKKFKLFEWNGMQIFSMSLIAGRDKGICQTEDRYAQLLCDVVECADWNVDIFVVDLPSGSGSIFGTAMEIFGEKGLVGNIVVSQPLMKDALKRTLNLHKYLEIPVLGVIENMAYLKVGDKVFYPFGRGEENEAIYSEFGVECLGRIPLDLNLAENVKTGNPILGEEGSKVIERAVTKILEAKTPTLPILEKLKKVLPLQKIKALMEELMAKMIVNISTHINIPAIRQAKGFTEKKPFLLVITDESGTKELTRVAMKITEEGIKVLKEPKEVDYEIMTDFHTIARMVMGYKRVGDQKIPYDPIDAWLMGDIKVYGRGYTPRTLEVFQKIFKDEALMGEIRERYGPILDKWT